MMMAQKSTDDAATKAVCQKRPSKRIVLGARRREGSNVEVRNHFSSRSRIVEGPVETCISPS